MSDLIHFVTRGVTESGDDLPTVYWGTQAPTDEEVDNWYREWSPIEYEEVGFVNWELDTLENGR